MEPISRELVTQCIAQFESNTDRIHTCCTLLNEDEIWKRPNSSSNSIGNLILHLCGNVSQYVISSLGHNPDIRRRDLEFEANGGKSKKELLELLDNTITRAIYVMNNLSDRELLLTRHVQGFEQTGVHILIHVTEHYSYHVGQIAFWVKLLKDTDLGFYAGQDLNTLNPE